MTKKLDRKNLKQSFFVNKNEKLRTFSHFRLGKLRTLIENRLSLFCLEDICRILKIENIESTKKILNEIFNKKNTFKITIQITELGVEYLTLVENSEFEYLLNEKKNLESDILRNWKKTNFHSSSFGIKSDPVDLSCKSLEQIKSKRVEPKSKILYSQNNHNCLECQEKTKNKEVQKPLLSASTQNISIFQSEYKSDLKTYRHQDFGVVRIVGDCENPLLVAEDIAKILKYENLDEMLEILSDDEHSFYLLDGKNKKIQVINESGFFSAIVLGKSNLRSKKFKEWVSNVVIPRFKKMDFEEDVIQGIQKVDMRTSVVKDSSNPSRSTKKEELCVFVHKTLGQIRILERNNVILFCLKDVCNLLDIKNLEDIKNYIIKEFDDCLDQTYPIRDSLNRIEQMVFINESQLYYVLMQGNKSKIKIFRGWITEEILPTFRANRLGEMDVNIEGLLRNPDLFAKLLERLKKESEARIQAEAKISMLTHINKTYTMTELAKELHLKSATQLNKILCKKGIQYFVNGVWVMRSQYSSLGYENFKQEALENGHIVYTRRITGVGREFILSLFATL